MFVLYWGGGSDTAVDIVRLEDRFYNVTFQVIIFVFVVDVKHVYLH